MSIFKMGNFESKIWGKYIICMIKQIVFYMETIGGVLILWYGYFRSTIQSVNNRFLKMKKHQNLFLHIFDGK